MKYEPRPPANPKINISDSSGLKTFFICIGIIAFCILVLFAFLKALSHYSPQIVSRSLEQKIFRSLSAPKSKPQTKDKNQNLEKNKESKKVNFSFSTMVAQSEVLESFAKKLAPADYDMNFYIMELSQENAFCYWGDSIVISTKLIQNVKSENELAFVLAHEMGHSKHRHLIKGASFNVLFQVVLSLTLGNWGEGLSSLGVLKGSRDFERQADRFALEKVRARYGHTQGPQEFFKRLESQRPDWAALKWFEAYASTHPTSGERVDFIESHLDDGKDYEVILPKKSALIQALKKEMKRKLHFKPSATNN